MVAVQPIQKFDRYTCFDNPYACDSTRSAPACFSLCIAMPVNAGFKASAFSRVNLRGETLCSKSRSNSEYVSPLVSGRRKYPQTMNKAAIPAQKNPPFAPQFQSFTPTIFGMIVFVTNTMLL
jgi:hypothetical protein